MSEESVHHPAYYGGAVRPYEAIKVIEAWGLEFNLGNTAKYGSRAGKKVPRKLVEDQKRQPGISVERLKCFPEKTLSQTILLARHDRERTTLLAPRIRSRDDGGV